MASQVGGRALSGLEQFVELMRESVITQGVITTVALVGTFVLLVQGRQVPDNVWNIDLLVLAFYFGGKVQLSAMRMARKEREAEAGGAGGVG